MASSCTLQTRLLHTHVHCWATAVGPLTLAAPYLGDGEGDGEGKGEGDGVAGAVER